MSRHRRGDVMPGLFGDTGAAGSKRIGERCPADAATSGDLRDREAAGVVDRQGPQQPVLHAARLRSAGHDVTSAALASAVAHAGSGCTVDASSSISQGWIELV